MADTQNQKPWGAELFRLLVENVKDYAIFILDTRDGCKPQRWRALTHEGGGPPALRAAHTLSGRRVRAG